MTNYALSKRAEDDLLDIFEYGIERFGEAQARRYQSSMAQCFDLLAEQPHMGREAPLLGKGIRRHEHGRHVILYEEFAEGVLILALVHQSSVRRLKI